MKKPPQSALAATSQPLAVEADASELYERLRSILDEGRSRVARSVNSEMVRAYWQIGQAIVEEEQRGQARADYGARLLESLAARCKADNLKGFGTTNLKYMRLFFQHFPIRHALRDELSWTHYRLGSGVLRGGKGRGSVMELSSVSLGHSEIVNHEELA